MFNKRRPRTPNGLVAEHIGRVLLEKGSATTDSILARWGSDPATEDYTAPPEITFTTNLRRLADKGYIGRSNFSSAWILTDAGRDALAMCAPTAMAPIQVSRVSSADQKPRERSQLSLYRDSLKAMSKAQLTTARMDEHITDSQLDAVQAEHDSRPESDPYDYVPGTPRANTQDFME